MAISKDRKARFTAQDGDFEIVRPAPKKKQPAKATKPATTVKKPAKPTGKK